MPHRDPEQFSDEQLAKLNAWLDDDLVEDDRQALDREMETDPALRAELQAYASLDRMIREQAAPAPELDWERFTWQARARREAYESTRRRRLIFRVAAPLAAAAMVAFAVMLPGWFSTGAADGDHGAADNTRVAMVSVERASAPGAGGKAVVEIEVSRQVTAGSLAAMGPPSTKKTLIVSVTRPERDPAPADDWDALF